MKSYSKYKNIKTADGFDSKKEAKRFKELELMQRAGVIRNLTKQSPFNLLPSFKDKQGITERGIKYVADFVYFDIEKGSLVIEDVKSPFTKKLPAYIIKRKLVKFTYPEYLFLEV
jgi:hypothetical protein